MKSSGIDGGGANGEAGCIYAFNSLEECEVEVNDGGDEEIRNESLNDVQPEVHYESLETHATSDEEPVLLPVNRALLDEMNALSIELGAFASLLVDCGECSDDSDDETLAPVANDHNLLPSSANLPEATDTDDPVCDVTDATTSVHTANAQSDDLLNKVFRKRLLPSARPQSKYQNFLRAHPPKPSHTRNPKGNCTRPKPQQLLRTHMREILGSPTLWKEYQSKSFQQHIKRQQQARHVAQQEGLEAERTAAAHFKRAKFALKLSGNRPKKTNSVAAVRSSTFHNTTYLRRFCRDRPRPQPKQEPQQAPVSPMMKGLLCGVYLYGKRQLGLAYFTCTSFAQLHESVCQRFGVPTVLNFYRERIVATNSDRLSPAASRKRASVKIYQRITCFEQVHDGDRICATRDSYEDMTILCEWIKQRQERIHHMQQPIEPPKPSSNSVQPPKSTQNRARAFTAHTKESPSLWDANGRCMAVKKQLIV